MRTKKLRLFVRLFAVTVAVAAAAGSAVARAAEDTLELGSPSPTRGTDANVLEGRYIVVFEGSVERVGAETAKREQGLGFDSEHRYKHALEGFSARLTDSQVQSLRRDPEVKFVSEDRRVRALLDLPLADGEPTPPTGTQRILSATRTAAHGPSGAAVAVIDTGIQLDHPDLNAADGKDCVAPGTPAGDGNGHGTHVAGTIGAKNDGAGAVGVAPGTKTYAVRVLNNRGFGSFADVICGIEWVTGNRNALGIGVANMSLGGTGDPLDTCDGTTDALHEAICNSTAAGVSYAVAAGNGDPLFGLGLPFDVTAAPEVPAAYPEVLTVTAVSDSDGVPGGSGGPPGCFLGEADDEAATFSNFALTPAGQAHTIAAPGVCIRSTWLGSGYETISGTSMATPHVAAVVALCHEEGGVEGECADKTPAQTIAHLRSDAESFNIENPEYGFFQDPSLPGPRYYGFLTRTPGSDSLPLPSAPPNDDFAHAENLGTDPTAAAGGDNFHATKEADEPDHAGDPGGASVWYKWTAPSTEKFKLDTCDSDFDTLLAVYTGSSVNALGDPVASNDQACGDGNQSRVTFDAEARTTYRIAVDGFGDPLAGLSPSHGSIDLDLAPATPPANDDFADAESLGNGSAVLATGTNFDATKEPGEPEHAGDAGGASVWYEWTAPATGEATINTCDSDFDTLLAVYAGSDIGSLGEVASNDQACGDGNQSRVTFDAEARTTYRIAVDGFDGDQGSIELEILAYPPNDDFVNAEELGDDSTVSVTGTNLGATKETGEPDHADDPGGASVWYEWTAPATGEATINTCDSDFDTLLAVYAGSDIGSLGEVASNDQACGDGNQSRVTFDAEARTTYRIAVDGFSDGGLFVPDEGLIQLDLAAASSPPPGPGEIAGQVFDAESEAGIAAATVDCRSGGSATTGGDGTYSIANVPAGRYRCTASASDYRAKTAKVTVASDQTTTANFALRRGNGGKGEGKGNKGKGR